MGLLDELQAYPELWQRMSSAMPDVTRTTDPQIPPTEEERFAEAVRQLDRQMKSAAFPTAVSTSPQVTGPGQMTQSSGEAVLQGLYDITPAGDVEAGLDAYRDPTAWNLTMAAAGLLGPGGDLLKKVANLSKAAKPLRRVYQGSPHTIPPEPGYPLGRFKDEFLGSGQGAATFGKGHYQAENIKTARDYQRSLSRGIVLDIGDLREYFKPGRRVQSYGGGTDEVLEFIENPQSPHDWSVRVKAVEGRKVPPAGVDPQSVTNPMARESWETVWEDVKGVGGGPRIHGTEPKGADVEKAIGRPLKRRGHVYESALKAADEDFLVWDKPLSEQSDRVKKALKNIGFDPDKMAKSEAEFQIMIRKKYDVVDYSVAWERMTDAERATANSLQTNWVDPELSGEEIYRAIEGKEWNPRTGVRIPSPPWGFPITKKPTGGASKTLQDEGIRGIKYFDAGSRYPDTFEVVDFNTGKSVGKFNDKASAQKLADELAEEGRLKMPGWDANQAALKRGLPGFEWYEMPWRSYVVKESRAAPETSNFVVFNPDDLEILKILGITGMVGTGAAVAAGANGQLPTN